MTFLSRAEVQARVESVTLSQLKDDYQLCSSFLNKQRIMTYTFTEPTLSLTEDPIWKIGYRFATALLGQLH